MKKPAGDPKAAARGKQFRASIPAFLSAFYAKHEVYPSVEDVAQYIKRTKSTAFFHLKKLRAEGVVVLLWNGRGWKPS